MSSQFCFVVEDDKGICGYALAAPDATDYHSKMTLSWIPEMQQKYQLPATMDDTTQTKSQVNVGLLLIVQNESNVSHIMFTFLRLIVQLQLWLRCLNTEQFIHTQYQVLVQCLHILAKLPDAY